MMSPKLVIELLLSSRNLADFRMNQQQTEALYSRTGTRIQPIVEFCGRSRKQRCLILLFSHLRICRFHRTEEKLLTKYWDSVIFSFLNKLKLSIIFLQSPPVIVSNGKNISVQVRSFFFDKKYCGQYLSRSIFERIQLRFSLP